MEKILFPKWKYHETKEARLVQDVAEEDALGADWFDTPDLTNDDPDAPYGGIVQTIAGIAHVHVAYPSWRYHATEAPRIVEDEAQDEALGEGWFHDPDLGAGPEVVEDDEDTTDVLMPLKGMAKAKLLETAFNEFGEDFAVSINEMTNAQMIAAIEARRTEPLADEAQDLL